MKKPKLYIIHGWTYTVAPWERTLALLKKQGVDVEMLNVPGLTSSSKKVWTIEEYVKWADRNIPDGAVALGHSNGGRILLNLCSEKPEKLSHLILLDAAGVYETSSKRDTARSLSKHFGFLKKIPGLSKIWHKLTGASDYARAPENMKRTLSNMLDSDKKLDLAKVTTPTSILWGADDTVTPPRQAEVMHEKLKNSTLKIYPRWTHAPYISHPDELAKAIYQAYRKPPVVTPKVDVTQAADVSASMALKKAAEPVVPDTTKMSASMAMKKAPGRINADDAASVSAALALSPKSQKDAHVSITEQLDGVEYENTETGLPERQAISTASVPKVSALERARRKMKRQPKVAKTSKKSPKTTKSAPKERK